ncbi:hypothetical protein AOXY_G27871 [Acipenser oxyrinchus oxyrinchus]|uniref:Uncharacterized protein n=1 Tax=Acipenser oxyrinchus oxyrinchus TaxID=40147 RepID=A0AAD8CNF1_ACIOX|nr:hypothetical protein AOXY_G27871 [Acipenser oxyrinchus oxyrinchus]
MGNYRTKLRKAGCLDVAINRGKRGKYSPEGESATKNIKRPKRSEANFIIIIIIYFLADALIQGDLQSQHNRTLISQKMDQTFPLRRRELVETGPPVQKMVERWPALFTESQVFAEFNRIACKNLQRDFFEALDRYTPRFIHIFKSKTGSVGRMLAELLEQISGTSGVTAKRSVVLRGIPILLGDVCSEFYRTCFDYNGNEDFAHTPVGLLTVIPEDTPNSSSNMLHLDSVSIAIIVEGGIVMKDIRDLPLAVCLLFGLSYALHLDYPNCMKNTFNFIQQVILELGQKTLKPKLQSLKNQLLA